jgi:hypothetical protein
MPYMNEHSHAVTPTDEDVIRYAQASGLDFNAWGSPEEHARIMAGSLPVAVVHEIERYLRNQRFDHGPTVGLDAIARGVWPEAGRRQKVQEELDPKAYRNALAAIQAAKKAGTSAWVPHYCGSMLKSRQVMEPLREFVPTNASGAERMSRLEREADRLRAVALGLDLRDRYRRGEFQIPQGCRISDVTSEAEDRLAVQLATERGWLDETGYARALNVVRGLQS